MPPFPGQSRYHGCVAGSLNSVEPRLALCRRCALASTFRKESDKNMEKSNETRVDPLKDEAFFMDLVRKLIFRVAPYRGVLSVTFLNTESKTEPGPIRYTSVHGEAPKEYEARFSSVDEPGAGEALLSLAVSFYRDLLRYDGDIVIALHEARSRDPLCGVMGTQNIYVEFGGVGAADYTI